MYDTFFILIIVCVKIVTYSILVNGKPKGLIHLSMGLRQRDPLSPFLFLLCIEGLHGLINKVASNGDITGFRLCRQRPKLTHLVFTDDSLLFCRVNSTKCSKVMDLLQYMKMSQARKLIETKQPYSSANQLLKPTDKSLKGFLEFVKSDTMKNT